MKEKGMKLGTIEAEAAACRKAWKGVRAGALGWHCHHEKLLEAVGSAEERILYILSDKPKKEQALRLRLFRPVQSAALAPAREAYEAATAPAREAYDAATAPAREAYEAALAQAHSKECPGCPWDPDRHSIFSAV